ncbi:MAG: glycoside hydrolase family 2 protein, partial [Pseudomonadota bacterium]
TDLDLSGPWQMRDAAGDYDAEMALPGDGISALQAAGLIADPYRGRNEYDTRWIAERDWTVSREINLDRIDLDLVLEGIDTVATVHLNGVIVLEAQNAFRTYRVDVSKAGRIGQNLIEIHFPAVTRVAAARQADQPFYVPYHPDNCPIPNGNMLRKPQCDFGWDWNIALAPFGVYGAMRLEVQTPLRVDRLAIDQDHSAGTIRVSVTVHVKGAGTGQIRASLDGQTQRCDAAGAGMYVVAFDIEDPKLWWPAGQGAQPLYNLIVELDGRQHTRRIGLRQIAHLTDTDEIGRQFGFAVNGRPIFARGANWIPADALAGRISQNKTRALLQSAVDANMNMIRVWGGGQYEPDWFYDICDELGLLVWQDFMFACNLYPSDVTFLGEVDAEARETVARLHHHACIALWCGDNELVGALSWYKESRENRDRYLVAYDRLNRTLERALRDTDPQANWWPSSPSRGRLDFGDGWHDDTAGDMHFWSVWHEGRDFDHYRDVHPRFCSEFGFQSYPSMDVIRSFADPRDFNIAAPVIESHQKNAGGNARIAETMVRYFRFPNAFEDFVYLSQVQQALAIKTAVTAWRADKPRCMGMLIWQLNDTWPVCSWSSLDYGGGWKILHHAARRFYAPVTVVARPDDECFAFLGVNDTAEPVDLTVSVQAMAMDGTCRDLAHSTRAVGPDRAESLLSIPSEDLRTGEVLIFDWSAPGEHAGSDHFAPVPYKALDLPEPGLRIEIGENALTLSARRPAFFVSVEPSVPGRLSDNGVLVRPGCPATLTFAPDNPAARAQFSLRDLHSATYEADPGKGARYA